MSRGAAWLFLALAAAWVPTCTAPQLEIVLQWLLKDGVSSDAAVAALRDPAALESALVQAAVSALRAAGLTNLTNESLALELRNFTAGLLSPTPPPAPAPARPESTPAPAEDVGVWVPVVLVGAVGLVSLGAVVGMWVLYPPYQVPRGAPVLPHRIRVP